MITILILALRQNKYYAKIIPTLLAQNLQINALIMPQLLSFNIGTTLAYGIDLAGDASSMPGIVLA